MHIESSKQRNSLQPRSSSARPLAGHLTDVTMAYEDGQLVAATRWSCLGRVPFSRRFLKVETSSSFGLYGRTLFVVNLFLIRLSKCSFDIIPGGLDLVSACILTTLAWSCACKWPPLSIGRHKHCWKIRIVDNFAQHPGCNTGVVSSHHHRSAIHTSSQFNIN